MAVPVWRGTGQVLCRMPLCWNVPVFLMLRCGLWILGRKTRGKGHSHRTVSTVHVGRDPLREVLARFLYRKVTLCPLSVL